MMLCSAKIRYIVVNPERRGRGIGSTMLASTLRELEAAGCSNVAIDPLTSRNEDLYRRHGFTYPHEDMLTMSKVLGKKA